MERLNHLKNISKEWIRVGDTIPPQYLTTHKNARKFYTTYNTNHRTSYQNPIPMDEFTIYNLLVQVLALAEM